MAQRYEKYRVKKRRSNLRLPGSSSKKDPAATYDPAKQVEGLEKRLEGSGIDVEKATDKRNFLEKALNLTEDQNFLFDVFEVLGRPQQALFGAINAVQKGESFAEGFKSGLSGENYTNFSKILNEAGFGEEDSFGADDVVGFLGDVFLDPADLGIMAVGVAAAPVTGGTSVGGATSTVAALNAAQEAGRFKRFLNWTKKAAVKGKEELVKSMKNIGKRMKEAGRTTAKFYGELGKDILTKGKGKKVIKDLFAKTVKLADGSIVRKVGVTDITMASFGNLLKKGGKAVNWTVRTGVIPTIAKDFETYVETWDNILKATQGAFNAAARVGEKILVEAQMAARKATFGALFGNAWYKRIMLKIDDVVEAQFKKRKLAGEIIEDVAKEKAVMKEALLKDLTLYAEHKLDPTTTVLDTLNSPNKYSLPIDDKVKENIKKALNSKRYQSIKDLVGNTTKKKVYERQVRRLSARLAENQELFIINLQDELANTTDEARKAEINTQIQQAKAKIEEYTKLKYNQSGYEKAVRTVEEGIANGELGDDFRRLVDDSKKAIDEDAYNLFDELFVESTMTETGQRVYVLRKSERTEKIIDAINTRTEVLAKIVSDTSLNKLKNLRRFTENSAVYRQIRKLLSQSGINKTIDDIFALRDGMYTVVNEEAFEELLELARPMQQTFQSSRFLSEIELQEIAQKFTDGFEYQKEYDDIINQVEIAMQWYDRRYGTKFFQKKEGYLKHALTQEAKETLILQQTIRKAFGEELADAGEGILLGNTRVFRRRKYNMTVAEANRVARFNAERALELNKTTKFLEPEEVALLQEKATMNLFSEYFNDSVLETLQKMNEYGSAIQVMNKSLVAGVLADKDIVRFGPDVKSKPLGFAAVKKKTLRDKLKLMSGSMVDSSGMQEVIEKIIDKADGAYVYIDSNIYKMIGRLNDPKAVSGFTKLINFTNNFFKRTKVFSLGFHFKNLVGNAANLYLAGVPVLEIGRILISGISARKIAIKNMDLFAEIAAGTKKLVDLTPKQKEIYDAYRLFVDGGFSNSGRKLYDLDELVDKTKDKELNAQQKIQRAGQKARKGDVPGALIDSIDGALMWNVNLNETVDGGYRLGYIMSLKRQGLPDEEIIKRVKLALLDPSSLTAAEDTIRKYIPFYTFAKKNLAFQMRNVFENPVQYNRFLKGVRSTWEAVGVDWEEDLQQYQRDNLWLPIPLTMKDGKYYQLKTSFPVSDFGEFIENPARKILASVTPLVRAPIETTMNQQFFSEQPIERFEGQKGRMLGDLGFSARGEYLVGQTGIDRLMAPVANVISLLKNNDPARIAPTVASQGDVETARRSRAYDQLEQLRDLFRYYKQEQIPILTLSEIENINKPRSTLAQRLAEIQRRRNR